jgi:hypothetical protein
LYYFAPPLNECRKGLLMKAFDFLDQNGNGVLDLEDLKRGRPQSVPVTRQGAKISSSEVIFANLIKCFDTN